MVLQQQLTHYLARLLAEVGSGGRGTETQSSPGGKAAGGDLLWQSPGNVYFDPFHRSWIGQSGSRMLFRKKMVLAEYFIHIHKAKFINI